MATSSVMKSSLVLVLLLSAVVASHAHEVSCKNSCKDPIWLNGILVPVGKTVILKLKVELELTIVVVVIGKEGGKHTGTYKCPEDVKALEFQYNKVTGFLEVKIIAVLRFLGGILESVLGAVFSLIKCNLHY